MKIVGGYVYVHASNIKELPRELQDKVIRACNLLKELDNYRSFTWTVLKVSKKFDRVTLLHYPGWWRNPFPELKESLTVDIENRTVKRLTFNPDNPPIIHRKELFMASNSPYRAKWARVTRKCEDAGCFQDTKRIGRKKFWNTVLKQKGLSFA